MKIVIPMAGRGSRFERAGFTNPKPLIDVKGKPMIQRVIENIGVSGEYIFLALKEHVEKYELGRLLPEFCGDNKCTIVEVNSVTEGAACTVLLAKNLINNNEELLLANSDQLVICNRSWNQKEFLQTMHALNADGGILTFEATESKWSFAKLDEVGRVTEVAEKKPISNHATVGIYYFKSGKLFVTGAEKMIEKNIRTNNEFYVCPVYNELIAMNKLILSHPVSKMCGIGTPEDLELYLKA